MTKTITTMILGLWIFAGSYPAYATVEQFIELCQVDTLPEQTQKTFDTLLRSVTNLQPLHDENAPMDCDGLAKKLQGFRALDLPGRTFNYYYTPDLTPIGLLDWIEELNISNQKGISSLEPLTWLKLKKLSINGVKIDLYKLNLMKGLTSLSMTADNAGDLSAITDLKDLKKLSITAEQGSFNLQQVPPSIRELEIAGAGFNSLEGIGKLYNLSKLSLTSLKMDHLDALKSLNQRRLTELSIQNSSIDDYQGLEQFRRQTKLSITYCNLKDIGFIESMPDLNELNLEHNQVSDLSPLAGATSITTLNLNSNQIYTLQAIANLTSLETLELASNRLSSFTLGFWPKLQHLELARNQIGWGPHFQMAPEQYRLKTLGLYKNELRSLSTDLGKIKTLENLMIRDNKLMSVETLKDLVNLKTVDISDNKIVDLSPLGSLKKLQKLSIFDNPLSSRECPVQPQSICE